MQTVCRSGGRNTARILFDAKNRAKNARPELLPVFLPLRTNTAKNARIKSLLTLW